MKTKVVGLFLSTLLALSLVGVGYAYWTDVLYIDGSVTTGTFWGYLTLDTFYDVEWKEVGTIDAVLGGAEIEADGEPYDKTLTITIDNAYPGYMAHVHWDMHWMGSVPAHVDVTGLASFPDWLDVDVYVMDSNIPDQFPPDSGTPLARGMEEFIELMEDSQWHYCNEVHFCFLFKVIEDDLANPPIDPPQDETVTFGLQFNFYQYNLDPAPPA